MARDNSSFKNDLYEILKVRGYKPVPLDAKNQRVNAAQNSEVIEFTFNKEDEEYGKAWISVEDADKLKVYYDNEQQDSPSDITPGVQYDDTWTGLLKQLKNWAQRRQLDFELANKDRLGDDMRQREYFKMKERVAESRKIVSEAVHVTVRNYGPSGEINDAALGLIADRHDAQYVNDTDKGVLLSLKDRDSARRFKSDVEKNIKNHFVNDVEIMENKKEVKIGNFGNPKKMSDEELRNMTKTTFTTTKGVGPTSDEKQAARKELAKRQLANSKKIEEDKTVDKQGDDYKKWRKDNFNDRETTEKIVTNKSDWEKYNNRNADGTVDTGYAKLPPERDKAGFRNTDRDLNQHKKVKEAARPTSPTLGTRLVSKHPGSDGYHNEVRFSPEWKEYSVHHYIDGKHQGEGPVSYHGEDKQDALDSAKHNTQHIKVVNGKMKYSRPEKQLGEISSKTLGSYKKKALDDLYTAKVKRNAVDADTENENYANRLDYDLQNYSWDLGKKIRKRSAGLDSAVKRSNGEWSPKKRKVTREEVNEGYYPMGKKASYSDNVPSVKIILQHSRQIEEGEQRFRNVARIFLENADGERFLAPTNRPGVARVYARHIAEGGLPNDDRWNHIKSLCEEYNKMSGFVRATRNKQFNETTQSLVNEGANYYTNLRETLGKMTSVRGYNAYFESWTPTLMEDESDADVTEMFVREQTVDPRIESVMPILSRLHKASVSPAISEVTELSTWAEDLISETLELNELSPDTLGRYVNKASKSMYKDIDDSDFEAPVDKKTYNRFDGMNTAVNKLRNGKAVKVPAKEKQLDELSPNSLGRYAKKASNEKNTLALRQRGDYSAYNPDYRDQARHEDSAKEARRNKGLDIANNKLAKEPVDEDLGPEQKRVGQLGPTEKVGPKGAVGKLVGCEESVDPDLNRLIRLIK